MGITENEALNRLMAYCSRAEHCRSELIVKLQHWGLSNEEIDRILAYLEKEQYIDEKRYCYAFIADKYRFAKWGKVKIAQALQMKRLSRDVYAPLLAEIDEEEYLSILKHLLAGKQKSVRAKNKYELQTKLMRFALGRGFEMGDICRCMQVADENDYLE